jgi:plastocyanin
VLLTETTIVPETVVVAAGDSLTWQNKGSTTQQVQSRGRPRFEDLSVSPGEDGSRRFRRLGATARRQPATTVW